MGIRLANIVEFDIADSCDGISISLWTAGCPHKCPGCHNSELWDGSSFPIVSKEEILNKLNLLMKKSEIKKNLSILGGEPLNRRFFFLFISNLPSIKKFIFLNIFLRCLSFLFLSSFKV